MALEIREAGDDDWEAIEPFFREIVASGETYAYEPGLTDDEARAIWMVGPPGVTFVATEEGRVVGSANAYANRPGPGSHVASASFMVDPGQAGRGVGRALGERVLEWASNAGFMSMQFNAVVESNLAAVSLWRSLGFEIVGTVPRAFRLPDGTHVGLYVMYRRLDSPRSR
jgi:L-amino acid N-acyltransferase YncA